MAWLDSTPALPKKGKQTDHSKKPRRELSANAAVKAIQPADDIEDLLSLAFECGLSNSGGMGITAITWQDITAWQAATGSTGLWLATAMMAISRAYVSAYYEYNDSEKFVLSPLDGDVSDEQRKRALAEQAKTLFE